MNINTLVATYSDLTTADEVSENESLLRVLILEYLTQQQTILQLYRKLETVLADMSKQAQPLQALKVRNEWLEEQFQKAMDKNDAIRRENAELKARLEKAERPPRDAIDM